MADDPPSLDSDEIERLVHQVAAAPSVDPSPELFPLRPGTVVAGAYRIDARIGVGGMGIVHRATDLALGRSVALKLHRRRPAPDRLDRLMREASVMAHLSHPNVVTVFEVGHHDTDDGDSRVFIAMEYVDGGSIQHWSQARRRTWREVLDAFLQAGAGLAAAHAAGVVHRDFKPDNVLVDSSGRVRVADFGLARLGPDDAARTSTLASTSWVHSHTRDGSLVGTPAYMAPEQWRGEAGTPASDQFAFCVSLYEMLYRSNPLAAQRLHDPLAAEPPRWAALKRARVPARVFTALRRGLAHDPAARYERLEDLLTALRDDPWRRRLRLGAAVVVLAGTSGIAWAVGRTPTAACDAQTEIVTVWNDDARDRVRHNLEAGDKPYGPAVAGSTLSLLDAYAVEWTEEDDAACRDEREGGRQAARRACLRSHRRRFAALVETLPSVDTQGRERAVTAASGLPSPSECASAPPVPVDPEVDPETQQTIEAELEALRTSVTLAQYGRARAQRAALQTVLDAKGTPSMWARFEMQQAFLAAADENSDVGIAALDRALSAALRAADPQLLARVASELSIELTALGRPKEAARALLIAEAATEDIEPPVRLRLFVMTARAAALKQSDRFAEGVEESKRAVALARSELGEEHPVVARLLGNVVAGQLGLRRYDEALETIDVAIEITARTFSSEHPRMAHLMVGRGEALRRSGRFDESIQTLREAVRIYRTSSGETAPPTVRASANLASSLMAHPTARAGGEAENEEARALLEPIAERLEAEGRLDEGGNETLWDNLGGVALRQGRYDEAIELVSRSLAGLERAHGPDSVRLFPPLTKLAIAQRQAGRYDDARRTVDRVMTIAIADGDTRDRARMLLLRGQLEHDAGNLDEARRALEAALPLAEEAGAPSLVRTAKTWLAKLTSRPRK